MILDHHVIVDAAPDRVWGLVMDVPAVSTCVPGVESVTQAWQRARSRSSVDGKNDRTSSPRQHDGIGRPSKGMDQALVQP